MRIGDVEAAVRPEGDVANAVELVAMEIKREFFEVDLGMSFWMGLFTKALAERFLEKNHQLIELQKTIENR